MTNLILKNFKRAFFPLLSISLLVLGNSYYTTLTTLQMHGRKVETSAIGIVISSYFLGFVLGALLSRWVISRFGHVKVYLLVLMVTSACVVFQAFNSNNLMLIGVRFLVGMSLACAIVTIESWIVASVDGSHRARIFAIYTLVYYGAQALSQLFFVVDRDSPFVRFTIILCLVVVAALPLWYVQRDAPKRKTVQEQTQGRLPKDLNLFGLFSSLLAGSLYGLLYTVLPLFLSLQKCSDEMVGFVMTAALMGGALLLYPISNWADQHEKGRSILTVSVFCILLSPALLIDPQNLWQFSVLAFLLFGFVFALYPIALSYTVERLKIEDMVDGTSLVLFAFGLGAMLSPMVATSLMQRFGANAFVSSFVVFNILTVFTYIWNKRSQALIPGF